MYAEARRIAKQAGWYLLPNAMKLIETVVYTASEVGRTETKKFDTIVLPTATGTIASGVLKGLMDKGEFPNIILYLGYSRPRETVLKYTQKYTNYPTDQIRLIDEGCSYRKSPKDIQNTMPFPASKYYEQGAWDWILRNKAGFPKLGKILFWNAGV
jgi:hypothetical protein